MSTAPSSSLHAANALSTAVASPASACTNTPPTASATAIPATSMSTQQICAPSAASRVAVARPMPEAAPVMSATFPSSWPISSPVVDVDRTLFGRAGSWSELDDDQPLLGHLAHRVVRAFLGVAAVLHAAIGHLVGSVGRHLVHDDATEVERVRRLERGL